MSTKTLTCAIYTRKSTDEGLDQEFNSLDAQREACAAYIKSQANEGWRLRDERFDDGGYSGGSLERPAIRRLIDGVKAGRINVIIVYKIDRLTRSLADFARLVEILDANNASFVSVTQQFNTTSSMGRLTLNVLLSFAQFEREVTSERIRDKVAASKRKGMWMGGHPPMGYDIVNRRLAVNREEAAVVERIFKLALKTSSLTELARHTGAKGIHAKKWRTQSGRFRGGGPLTRTSLGRLLRNPVFIGKIAQGGKLHDGEHNAILSEELWSAVQVRLDRARQGDPRRRRNEKNQSLLKDRLFDDTGNHMSPTHARKGAVKYRYYASTPHIRGSGMPVGTISRINANRIESLVLEGLREAGVASPGSSDNNLIEPVERVVLHASEIEVRFRDGAELNEPLRIAAPLAAEKNGKRIIDDIGAKRRNEGLIKAISLAHDWVRKLKTGKVSSVKDLAKTAGYSERYIWKVLRLAHLAPDITEAILNGCHPSRLTLHALNKTALPLDWAQQRRALGLPDKT